MVRMEAYVYVASLLTLLVLIIAIIWVVGEIRSRKNPRVEFRIERYIISHKYAFPSTSPVILVGYYNRLDNSIMLSISSIALMVWRKISRQDIKDSEVFTHRFINEFVNELNTILIHEFTEWALPQIEFKRILTHDLWNYYIRKLNR